MFSAFPSDFAPRNSTAVVPPTGYTSDVPLIGRTQRQPSSRPPAASSLSYAPVSTLRYPGALPTSGINPVIVEGRVSNRLVGYAAPSQPTSQPTAIPSHDVEPTLAATMTTGVKVVSSGTEAAQEYGEDIDGAGFGPYGAGHRDSRSVSDCGQDGFKLFSASDKQCTGGYRA